MKATFGDYLFPLVLSTALALIGLAVGFVLGIAGTAWLPGESSEFALAAAPGCAILTGGIVFVLCFRKLRP